MQFVTRQAHGQTDTTALPPSRPHKAVKGAGHRGSWPGLWSAVPCVGRRKQRRRVIRRKHEEEKALEAEREEEERRESDFSCIEFELRAANNT